MKHVDTLAAWMPYSMRGTWRYENAAGAFVCQECGFSVAALDWTTRSKFGALGQAHKTQHTLMQKLTGEQTARPTFAQRASFGHPLPLAVNLHRQDVE